MIFEGVITAMVTPMKESGELDLEGLKENIHQQIEAQVNGIFILGTTGETPTLQSFEQEEVIKTTIKAVRDNLPVLVGCGTYATVATIANIERAASLGASGAIIVTPYYNCPTQEGLLLHFKAISKASSIPLMLYNIPKRCGRAINIETLEKLIDEPKIIGIKESTGDVTLIQSTIDLINNRPDLRILSGDDILTLPMMALGGQGVVSVISNLVPEKVVSLVQAARKGDFLKARSIHNELLPLMKCAFIETNPIPIKKMMNLSGLPAGPCRLPLCNMSAQNIENTKEVLKQYEIQQCYVS